MSALFLPDETHSILRDTQEVIRSETGIVKETMVILENQPRWFRTSIQPVRDSEGVPYAALISAADISEMKGVEQALRQSEARRRALLEAIPDLIFRFTRAGVYLDCHVGDPSLLVAPPETLSGGHLRAVLPPAMADLVLAAHERAIQTGAAQRFDYTLEVAGETRTLESRISKIDDFEMLLIVRDVTAQREAESYRLEQERLRATLKKEQEFNALIHKAVSAMSHDVRSPLTAIATSKDILERYYDRLDENKRQARLDAIDHQIKYLTALVDEMVLTVKSSLSHTEFKPAPVDLAALCQLSLNQIKDTTGTRHQLRFLSDGQVKIVTVDETLVSRILINLLSNAVKFSPENSEIRLGLNAAPAGVMLRVSDQGMGIGAQDLPHIFAPFFRAGQARNIAGTGLGLNIVKACVERHQGRIDVDSEVGKGTTFSVWLPIAVGVA